MDLKGFNHLQFSLTGARDQESVFGNAETPRSSRGFWLVLIEISRVVHTCSAFFQRLALRAAFPC